MLFVGAAAFFAASEAAIVSVSRISARTFAEKGMPGAARLKKLLDDRNRTLTTILIANTFVLLATSGYATYVFVRLGVPQAPLWSTLITTIVLLIFGEILPKTLAVSNSSRAALRLAAPLRFFTWLLAPLTSALLATTNLIVRIFGGTPPHGPYVTEDDIKTLVNVGVEQNVLEEGERELIHSIFEFGDTIVREVMTPRTDMIAVPVTATPQARARPGHRRRLLEAAGVRRDDRQRHRRRPRSRIAGRAGQRHDRHHIAAPVDAAGSARPREQAHLRAAARDAARQIFAGDRRGRIRRNGGAGHDGRPARRNRRRDSRRARRGRGRADSQGGRGRNDRRSRNEHRRRQRGARSQPSARGFRNDRRLHGRPLRSLAA